MSTELSSFDSDRKSLRIPIGTRTRLILVRHGQTSLNAAGVLRGRLDPSLDSLGRQQAQELGAVLVERGVRLVVASPLRRAVETAQAIAMAIDLEVEFDERLVDRDYGRWSGKPKAELEAAGGRDGIAPGVESLHAVRVRATEAVLDLAVRAAGESAVAVSHDVVLREILTYLSPSLGGPEQLTLDTGCLNIVDLNRGKATIVGLNEHPRPPEPSRQP